MTKLIGPAAVFLSTIAAVGFVHETGVRACSAPLPGVVSTRQVIPADGSTNVPSNARVILSYEGTSGGVPDHPKLRAPDGTDVPVTVSTPVNTPGIPSLATYVLVPGAPLKENTTYTVLSDYAQLPCVQNNLAIVGAGGNPTCFPTLDGGDSFGGDAGVPPTNVISSFTTGAGPDTTPPTLSGSLSYTVGSRYTCTAGACCGPYDAFTVGFTWDKSANAGTTVVYELSDANGVVLMPVPDSPTGDVGPSVETLNGAFLCSGTVTSSPAMINGTRFLGKAGLYTLVAIDVAGNRSQPISVNVTLDCSAPVDAGVDGGPSDGPADAPFIPDLRDEADRSPTVDMDSRVAVDAAPDLSAVDLNNPYAAWDARPDQTVIDVPRSGAGGAAGTSGTGISIGAGGAIGPSGTGGLSGAGGAGGTSLTGGSGPGIASDDGGCSCRVGGGRNHDAGLLLLALGLLLTFRRRGR